MSILAALVAALKAIPALAALIDKIIDEWKAYDTRKREAESQQRLQEKNGAVDVAIPAQLNANRVPDATSTPGQLTTANGASGLSNSGDSGSGVVPGRPENDKPTGT